MPFFFDVTPNGETRAAPHGPFDTETEAGDSKTLYDTDRPDDTTDAVYEAGADHHSTFPQAVMVYSRGEFQITVYSDGTEDQI